MELVTHRIKWRRGDHGPHVVIPIGDIQWAGRKDAIGFERLKETIARGIRMKARFIGMGDYTDFASPSNRQRLKAAALYDTAEDVIDDKALDLVRDLYEEVLRPTRGMWLGLLAGHHFMHLQEGDTTDMRLCQMLEAPFLGDSAFVRLVFEVQNSTQRYPIVFWAHHGSGGGQKMYAPIMKLEGQVLPYVEGADVLLIGHMTKMAAEPVQRLMPRFDLNKDPDLIDRKIYLVGTGGYSKAYVERVRRGGVPSGGYAEKRMLPPAVIGSPTIRIVPRLKYRGLGKASHQTTEWVPEISVEI